MKSTAVVKSTVSSLIGNVLEWYEYMLYAYLATYISTLFFPSHDSRAGMMATFATFAVGLAARPIGGIIFGRIGDKYSRKRMLSTTMLLMSIPTFCIGILPSYASIGIFAPIILIILRIIQGVALGGEFGASCTYLYESAPNAKRGFFGTLALSGVGIGLVFSSCTILLIEKLFTQEQIGAFAWRIPFFISVTGAMIGLYMRRALLETGDFLIAKQNNMLLNQPIIELFKNHKKTILKLFSIFLTTQVAFFVVFVFGKTMMIQYLHFNSTTAGIFNLFTLISYTFFTFFVGYLSDKIDKRLLILFGVAGLFVSSYPFIWSLKSGNSLLTVLLSIFLGMLIAAAEGTLNPLVAESFPTQIRATSVAFCWNMTSVMFGATAPIAAMWLTNNTGGNINCVAYFLMTACSITATSLLYLIFKHSTN